jgi:hypothetical protein
MSVASMFKKDIDKRENGGEGYRERIEDRG